MSHMTLAECRKRVQEIRDKSDDDEAAHAMEDELHADVLRVVAAAKTANQRFHATKLAAIALQTLELDFQRWCA